jgi:hypothetical protein
VGFIFSFAGSRLTFRVGSVYDAVKRKHNREGAWGLELRAPQGGRRLKRETNDMADAVYLLYSHST